MKNLIIVKRVFDNLENNFDDEFREELSKEVLKLIADKLGTKYISECITDHPNKGYFVRYLDEVTPKMLNESYNKQINSNEDLIKSILH